MMTMIKMILWKMIEIEPAYPLNNNRIVHIVFLMYIVT